MSSLSTVHLSLLLSALLALLASHGCQAWQASRGVAKARWPGAVGLPFANQPAVPRYHQHASTRLKMSAVESNPYYQNMDAYQILGVPRGASKKDIKVAYKKLVATWHPDKFPDDPVKKKEGGLRMEKINRAYYCLEDEDRRRRYDTYGEQVI
jgi:hypothetical protein